MTKMLSLTTGIALAAMLVALPAYAEPVDFSTLVGAGPLKLEVSAWSGELSTASTGEAGQFYVGLTQGQLMNAAGTQNIGDPFYMYCVDFLGTIFAPTSFNVEVRSLAASAGADSLVTDNLALTLGDLRLQAVLGAGFGITPSGHTSDDSDIQEDIWNISGAHFAPLVNNMAADLAAANAALPTANFSNAYLLDITPEGEQNAQAFMPVAGNTIITTNANPVVPEPSTFGLLALALGGLAAAARRKLHQS